MISKITEFDSEFNIVKIDECNPEYITRFTCGNEEIDKYLKYKACGDLEHGIGVTKVFISNKNKEIIAYYTLNASAIVAKNGTRGNYSSAIELKMFAVNKKYQKQKYSKDVECNLTISDFILASVIKSITHIVENNCGANSIILYSVDTAVDFYKKNFFELFEEFMMTDSSNYLDGCVPMWFKL